MRAAPTSGVAAFSRTTLATVFVAGSMTAAVFSRVAATTTRWPSGVTTMLRGSPPTLRVATTAFVRVSRTTTAGWKLGRTKLSPT